jgi:hypothetical protein
MRLLTRPMHLHHSLFKTLRRQGVYFVLFDFIYVFISGELPPRADEDLCQGSLSLDWS